MLKQLSLCALVAFTPALYTAESESNPVTLESKALAALKGSKSLELLEPDDVRSRHLRIAYEILHLRALFQVAQNTIYTAGILDPKPDQLRNTAMYAAGCDVYSAMSTAADSIGGNDAKTFRVALLEAMQQTLTEPVVAAAEKAWRAARPLRNLPKSKTGEQVANAIWVSLFSLDEGTRKVLTSKQVPENFSIDDYQPIMAALERPLLSANFERILPPIQIYYLEKAIEIVDLMEMDAAVLKTRLNSLTKPPEERHSKPSEQLR